MPRTHDIEPKLMSLFLNISIAIAELFAREEIPLTAPATQMIIAPGINDSWSTRKVDENILAVIAAGSMNAMDLRLPPGPWLREQLISDLIQIASDVAILCAEKPPFFDDSGR